MPFYDGTCDRCGNRDEVWTSNGDEYDALCSECLADDALEEHEEERQQRLDDDAEYRDWFDDWQRGVDDAAPSGDDDGTVE